MPIEHINKTDTLNKGREKINAAIDGANAADVTSKAADTKATQALANSESTQTQLDTIVIDGDSSVEAAQARVDEKGDPHPTLKARIDDGMNSVNQQLAETVLDLEQRAINLHNYIFLVPNKEDAKENWNWQPAFQGAIDHVSSLGGGEVYIPHLEDGYLLNSLVPNTNNILEINTSNVVLRGSHQTNIWVGLEADNLIFLGASRITIENIRLQGSNREYVDKVKTGIKSSEYTPNIVLNNVYLHRFINKGIDLKTYSYILTNVTVQRCGEVGIEINEDGSQSTSGVFTKISVGRCKVGYRLTNANYTSLTTSFGDNNDLTFEIIDPKGFVMSGCGTERSNQALKVVNGRGVDVGMFYIGSMGSGDEHPNGVKDYLFEFEGCYGGHFGGSPYGNAGLEATVLFKECLDMTFQRGRISKGSKGAIFENSQITVLDEVKRTTSDMDYYIDPVNGRNDNVNHKGFSPETAVASWRGLLEIIPKNIDHDVNIYIMGDIDGDFDLSGFNVGGTLRIRSLGGMKSVNNINIGSSNGSIILYQLDITDKIAILRNTGVSVNDCVVNNLEFSYTSGVVQNSEIKNLLNVLRSSSISSSNNTGEGRIISSQSTVYLSGTQPTGTQSKAAGGQIFL